MTRWQLPKMEVNRYVCGEDCQEILPFPSLMGNYDCIWLGLISSEESARHSSNFHIASDRLKISQWARGFLADGTSRWVEPSRADELSQRTSARRTGDQRPKYKAQILNDRAWRPKPEKKIWTLVFGFGLWSSDFGVTSSGLRSLYICVYNKSIG